MTELAEVITLGDNSEEGYKGMNMRIQELTQQMMECERGKIGKEKRKGGKEAGLIPP